MRSRALAWSGLLYAAGILGGTLLAMPSGLSEREMEWRPVDEWLPGLQEHRVTFVASMWVFHASSVALIAFGIATGHRFAAAFFAVSGGAFLIETTVILAMGLTGETGALLAFRLQMALLASLLLAAGALCLGLAWWREAAMPRAIPLLALASAALGALGGASLVLEPMSYARTVGIVLFTLFAALVGAWSLRAPRQGAPGAR